MRMDSSSSGKNAASCSYGTGLILMRQSKKGIGFIATVNSPCFLVENRWRGARRTRRDGPSEVLLSMVLGRSTRQEQMVVTLLAWRYASAVIYPGYSPGLEPTQSQTNNPTRSNPLPVGQA
jgi:hypothetical protein